MAETADIRIKPKAFVVFTSLDGVDLDQDRLGIFQEKFKYIMSSKGLDLFYADFTVAGEETAIRANSMVLKSGCELLIIVMAVWTSDTTVLKLIEKLDLPVILFTTSLSPFTIGINGAQLAASTLKELGVRFKFIFGNIEDWPAVKKIIDFAFACSLYSRLKNFRIGVVGGRPKIMASLATDEFSARKVFGSEIIPIDYSDMEKALKDVRKPGLRNKMKEIKEAVGKVEVPDAVLEESVSYYFAFLNLVKEYGLGAIAVNCFPFPYIKAKTCLALSNLNDSGIPASCESDVNSAILMFILQGVTGVPNLNSDLIIEDSKENSIMFSHCGCGPFNCASSKKDIHLKAHYEVKTGLGVYYPVKEGGSMTTTVNLVGREGTYRLCALSGTSLPTPELVYEGNPITIRYKTNITDLINIIGNEGFGHHWIVSTGSHSELLRDLCGLLKIKDICLE